MEKECPNGSINQKECMERIAKVLKHPTVKFLREHMEKAGCPFWVRLILTTDCESQGVAVRYTSRHREGEAAAEEAKKSKHILRKLEKRQLGRTLDSHIEEKFGRGRLLAAISTRPGQCGRVDGYILEGEELESYMKKLQRKKGKGAAA